VGSVTPGAGTWRVGLCVHNSGGAAGPAGPTGATGIVSTTSWGGVVASIPGNGAAWIFAGPFATVTTTATQKLTGAAEAPLGLTAGAAAQITRVDLCYQSTAAGATVTNFSGGNWSEHRVVAERRQYVAVGSVTPGAGTWRVGLCVHNSGGAAAISDNDYVNGYVQVTN
jgi:hypothetical protein